MVVMSVHNSEGCVGQCDAKCHNATTPICDCICGGRYHGTARLGTFEQTRREHGGEIVAAAAERAAAAGLVLDVAPAATPELWYFLYEKAAEECRAAAGPKKKNPRRKSARSGTK